MLCGHEIMKPLVWILSGSCLGLVWVCAMVHQHGLTAEASLPRSRPQVSRRARHHGHLPRHKSTYAAFSPAQAFLRPDVFHILLQATVEPPARHCSQTTMDLHRKHDIVAASGDLVFSSENRWLACLRQSFASFIIGVHTLIVNA